MGYDLGIDVGTTSTAAAARTHGGPVDVVPLGVLADSMPTVVYLQDDGSLVVGETAVRRGAIDVAGASREFKRRLGDPAPLILRTSPFSADVLIGKVIDAVMARAVERFGEAPRHIVVTHPANWGPYKTDLLDQALLVGGVPQARRLTEPQAAAIAYTAQARVPDGAAVAIYDLGGGTFDAAVLRRRGEDFEPLGEPVGIERLGGIDFDEAIFAFVRAAVGERWPSDPDDPTLPAPMLQLRRSCTEAKELLSMDTAADIPVLLPGVSESVVIQRHDFETMISPRVDETLLALEAAIRSAGLSPSELHAVVPVGGSSRIPLVRRRLGERFPGLVSADIDPVAAIARGAALGASAVDRPEPAAPEVRDPVPVSPPPTPAPAPSEPDELDQLTAIDASVPSPPVPLPTPEPTVTAGRRARPENLLWMFLIAVFAVMAVAGPYTMLRDDGRSSGTTPFVSLAGRRFAPSTLTVPRGTTVVFDNDDVAPHTVTADDGSVDSGTLRPGQNFTLAVDGRLSYSCTIHPEMTASIEIEA